MQICIFFQIKSWSTLSLDVDMSFFNIADYETKKGSSIVVFVMFVLFSTYSINLFFELNPLFKKSFSFFYTYKNRSNFFFLLITRQIWSFTNQNPFFSQFSKNRSNIFSNQKILYSLISIDLNFSLQKANFF